jgi:hypothetical protein
MEKKQANLSFHHSEKFNANLFLLSGALDRLEGMKGEKLEGGKEVVIGLLDGLRRQLKVSQSYFPSDKASFIEKTLDDLQSDMELDKYDDARAKLGRVISGVATVSNEHINVLLKEDLI